MKRFKTAAHALRYIVKHGEHVATVVNQPGESQAEASARLSRLALDPFASAESVKLYPVRRNARHAFA